MTADIIGLPMESPFDRIRHEDDNGEHWYARELMILMGYRAWQDFRNAIDRAVINCTNSGQDPDQHFVVFRYTPKNSAGGRPGEDYRLTRAACYWVVLNGDPAKPETALGKTYFAVRTREAEVAPQRSLPQSYSAALRELASEAEAREAAEQLVQQQQKELSSARPKADFVDQFVVVPEDTMRLDDLAKVLGVRVQAFRKWLVDRKVIYRRQVDRYWSRSEQKMKDEFEYRAAAGFEPWFTLRAQAEAPRLNNGQLRQTLYANPVGQVRISELLKRHGLGDEANAA